MLFFGRSIFGFSKVRAGLFDRFEQFTLHSKAERTDFEGMFSVLKLCLRKAICLPICSMSEKYTHTLYSYFGSAAAPLNSAAVLFHLNAFRSS